MVFLLALATVYLWKKLSKSQPRRRARNVLAMLVTFTVIYGILCGSYFGVSPNPDSLLGRIQILDAKSQSQMMPLTIAIGVIHLSIANLIMAWLHRGQTRALAWLGWVVVMFGATVVGVASTSDLQEGFSDRLVEIGTTGLVGGLLAVVLFTSERPLFFTQHQEPRAAARRWFSRADRHLWTIWRCIELSASVCVGAIGRQAIGNV